MTFAQNLKDNLFQSWGFTYFLDVSFSQVKSFNYTDYAPNERGDLVDREFTGYTQTSGLSVLTGIYRVRYNVMNCEQAALTISLVPALSLSYVDMDAFSTDDEFVIDPEKTGLGQFNLPLLIGYESGFGAKKDLDSKWGWFVKLGYEYTLSPLVYQGKTITPYMNGAWAQPVLACAFRYKNKKDVLREFNLKIGHVPMNDVPASFANDRLRSPMTVRISFFRQIK